MLFKSEYHAVAIIGINKEGLAVYESFIETESIKSVVMIRPDEEGLRMLMQIPQLDLVINTTQDPATAEALRRIDLNGAEIISGLSAKILFGSAGKARPSTRSDEEDGGDKIRILNSLREVTEAVALAKNKEELLKLILNVAIKMCTADSGSIMLADIGKRFLKIEIADGLDSSIVRTTLQRVNKGIAGKVFQERKPMLISGADEHDVKQNRTDLVSSMCAPLMIGDEVVGVINLNTKKTKHVFVEADLQYLTTMADLTAALVKTSKEYEHSSFSTFMLVLVNSSRDILNLKYPIEEKLNLLVMKIANTFKAEICNYYSFNKGTQSFYIKASSAFNLKLLQGKILLLNEQIAHKVISADTTVCLSLIDQTRKDHKKWYIAQPVKVNEELVGVFFLHFISTKEDVSNEIKVMFKLGEMLSKELAKVTEIESSRMQSIKYSAISEVSFDIATASTLSELINIVVSNACLILEAENCVVWLKNQSTGVLEPANSYSLQGALKAKDMEDLDKTIAEDTSTNKSLTLVTDIGISAYKKFKTNVKSFMSMPLSWNGRFYGVISIYDKKSLDLYLLRNFSERDGEIFLNFCLQASKSIARFIMGDTAAIKDFV